MLKDVYFKLQVRANYRKKSQNLPSSIDQELDRPDRFRIVEKEILQIFKSGPSPRKCLGFQSNLSTYKRETLTTFWRLLEDFYVTLCEI